MRILIKSNGKITFNKSKFEHQKFAGLDVVIENPKGSTREGYDKDGKKWTSYMFHPYGFISLSEGVDGDGVDCYLGDNEEAEEVYIVHQNDPLTEKYDEDKVFIGFDSIDEAKEAYYKQYDKPDKFFGSIEVIGKDKFDEMIKNKKFKGKPQSNVFNKSMKLKLSDLKPNKKKEIDEDQLRAGIKVEMEHTKDINVAEKISRDHLNENPDYYKNLELVEDKKYSTIKKWFGKLFRKSQLGLFTEQKPETGTQGEEKQEHHEGETKLIGGKVYRLGGKKDPQKKRWLSTKPNIFPSENDAQMELRRLGWDMESRTTLTRESKEEGQYRAMKGPTGTPYFWKWQDVLEWIKKHIKVEPKKRDDDRLKVYRGITGNEGDRFLVTTDRSIAESHSKDVKEYIVDRSKLESGDEEIGFYDGEVPKNKIGDIEAWVNKKDLLRPEEPEKPSKLDTEINDAILKQKESEITPEEWNRQAMPQY